MDIELLRDSKSSCKLFRAIITKCQIKIHAKKSCSWLMNRHLELLNCPANVNKNYQNFLLKVRMFLPCPPDYLDSHSQGYVTLFTRPKSKSDA